MAKFLSIVLSVFLLSACATVSEDNDSQVAGTQGAHFRFRNTIGRIELRQHR